MARQRLVPHGGERGALSSLPVCTGVGVDASPQSPHGFDSPRARRPAAPFHRFAEPAAVPAERAEAASNSAMGAFIPESEEHA